MDSHARHPASDSRPHNRFRTFAMPQRNVLPKFEVSLRFDPRWRGLTQAAGSEFGVGLVNSLTALTWNGVHAEPSTAHRIKRLGEKTPANPANEREFQRRFRKDSGVHRIAPSGVEWSIAAFIGVDSSDLRATELFQPWRSELRLQHLQRRQRHRPKQSRWSQRPA